MDRLDPAVADRLYHGPAGAAGTENHRGRDSVPSFGALVQIGDEATPVGVRRADFSILEPERVGRSEFGAQFVRPIGQPEGGLLMRNRDIAAAEVGSSFLDLPHEIGKGLGRNFVGPVAPPNSELFQPMAMNERRSRMLHRIAGDKGMVNKCFT